MGLTTPAWRDGLVELSVRAPAAERVQIDVHPVGGTAWLADLSRSAHDGANWELATDRLRPGDHYGLRVSGPQANPNLLLLDPCGLAVAGEIDWAAVDFGGGADTGPHVPWTVVVDPAFDWLDDPRPAVPMADTVIYEANVRSYTARHPAVPEPLRGTYLGMAHPAVVEHLVRLGVTTLELLPVQHSITGLAQWKLGLRNIWGYDPVAWFAPNGRYATGDDGQQVRQMQELARAMHGAGIEVLLDVVYNHTGEYDHGGPTITLRGFDDTGWYRHNADGSYEDTTGCRNTVDMRPEPNRSLAVASLRHWVDVFHVDGFRFDLASTLVRGDGGPDASAPILADIARDPVLAGCKLIAEPWDAAPDGYMLGKFPAPWSQWNDRFRNEVRDTWRTATPTREALATRMAGSSDLFGAARTPSASINFVTAHDGFTLADLVAYEQRLNQANGQNGEDGASDNRSWNCGVEGPTDDAQVVALRARQQRNLMATLMLARGVPMLLGGDEIGHTQLGNNNAYCQDNEVSWLDWDNADHDLVDFTRRLVALRSVHGELRGDEWLSDSDVSWRNADGSVLDRPGWWSHDDRLLVMAYPSLVIVLNPGASDREVVLPPASGDWRPLLDTWSADGKPSSSTPITPGATVAARARSVLLFAA